MFSFTINKNPWIKAILESFTYNEHLFIEVIQDHPTWLRRFIEEAITNVVLQFAETCFS